MKTRGILTCGGRTWRGRWRQQPIARKCKPSSTLPDLYPLCTKAKSLCIRSSWVSFHYRMSLWRHGKKRVKKLKGHFGNEIQFWFQRYIKIVNHVKQQNGWNPLTVGSHIMSGTAHFRWVSTPGPTSLTVELGRLVGCPSYANCEGFGQTSLTLLNSNLALLSASLAEMLEVS